MKRAVSFLLFIFVFVACGASSPPTSSLVVIPTAARVSDEAPSGTAAPSAPNDDGSEWRDDDASVPVSSADPATGSRLALVTIVEFSDFQCPYCARAKDTIGKLRAAYSSDDVRIVFKHEPLSFHPNAKPAAEAAQGVFALKGADAFWRFHDLAFDNQRDLARDKYLDWASLAGVVNLAAFERGLDDHTWAAKVELDYGLSQRVGASGTPTFFVNGAMLSGAQPLESFTELVDAELVKARAEIAHGTPRARIYAVMSQRNKATSAKNDEPEADTSTVFKIPVGNQPMRGSKNALVTIVEFSDFQCPFCAAVQPTLAALRAKYGGDLRIVWRNEPLPFHPRAAPAAELALEARAQKGDTGFWSAHDELFADPSRLDDAGLMAIATRIGVDAARARAAIQSKRYQSLLDADADVAEDFEANGTPHFFINGRRLVGAQPQDKFEKIIDDELRRARALVAKGTSAANVYDELTKSGRVAAAIEKKIVALPLGAPTRGNAAAKVTIQEFADFQCLFCARAQDAITAVMKAYGTRVKLVWRDRPLAFHPDAALAAQAAREAFKQKGSAGFWQIHDLMFQNQKGLSRAALDGYARQMGLDMKKWNAALDSGAHKAAVDADAAVADRAGIGGTPGFVINGYFISGAQPFEKFRKVIDRAIAEAK